MKNLRTLLKEIAPPPLRKLKPPGAAGIPLEQRLFLFLAVLLVTIFLGITAILLLTGTFTAGLSESERFLQNELRRASTDIVEQYVQVSRQTVELAGTLARSIEQRTSALDLSPSDLSGYPQLLEQIISAEIDPALTALMLANGSGVFFILDATINPDLPQAARSRAGLYIRNMEPNVISASSPNITILRGFPGIARKRSLPLHSLWQMEFDIDDAPYYSRPLEAAGSNPHLPLSRLYCWSDALKLAGTGDEIMICAAPLIDSKGWVFGVCGIEVSAMLFKLSHLPNNATHRRLLYLLAPATGDTFELHRSLFAGSYSARMIAGEQDTLQISKESRHFYTYRRDRESAFLGLHTAVHLYPPDSAFADQGFTVAVMLPREDLTASINRLNLILFASLALMAIAGAALSFNLSNRFFVKPIARGLDQIRSADQGTATGTGTGTRTRIREIDELIDYLALRDRTLAEKARQENLSLDLLHGFLERTGELTRAERDVFKLYAEGCTAPEIAAKLYLSVNTIKTHSKHIYMKLGVTSREEIILYTNLLKGLGREIT